MEGELIHSPVISVVMIILFVIGYILILSEEKLKLNKAKPILLVGGIMWMILYVFFDAHIITEHFNHTIMEIANLFFFLMSAMTFIVLLEKTNFFEKVALKLLPSTISLKKLFIIIGLFTFFLSSIADNLTATLVVLSLVLTFTMEKKDKLKLSALVIGAANIGGTFLITGDVTTLMIFVKNKVTITGLLELFIPSLIAFFTLFALLTYKLKGNISFPKKDITFAPEKVKIFVIFILTIISIITLHILFHIPAVLTFLTGLAVLSIFTWKHPMTEDKDESKQLSTLDSIGEVEIDALMFFVGVLLAVGALSTVGVLENISRLYESSSEIMVTYFVGIMSAVVDNIPLTASILGANPNIDYLLLTYSVGVGGNLLIIGSAAGVVAMSKVKELTFMTYFKYFSLPMLISYTVGFALTYYFGLLF